MRMTVYKREINCPWRVRPVNSARLARERAGREQHEKSAEISFDFADFNLDSIFFQHGEGSVNLIWNFGTLDAKIHFTLLLMREELINFTCNKVHLLTELAWED